MTFQHALSGSEREDFLAVCEKSGAEGCLFVAEKSLDASAGGTVKTTNVVCPESGSVDGFIDLHTQDENADPLPAGRRLHHQPGACARRCACRRATPSPYRQATCAGRS